MKLSIEIARAVIWQRVTIGDRQPLIVHPVAPDWPIRAEQVVIGWHWSPEDGWHALDVTFHGQPLNPTGTSKLVFGMPWSAWPDDVTAIVNSLKPTTPPEGAPGWRPPA